MIITISGTPGSGKSTVGKLLAKKLKFKYYSIGGMRRAMAKERGLTLQEFNVLGEREAFTDRDIDEWQKKLGQENDNMVVEGRTSFYFIPHSVKIFLKANLTEAARRIFNDPAHVRRFEASHHYGTIKELAHGLRGRMASDMRRYVKYYQLNIYLPKHYDFVLDSTKRQPRETLQEILNYLANPIRGKTGLQNKRINNAPSASNGAKISKNFGKVDSMGKKFKVFHSNSTVKNGTRKMKRLAKVSHNKRK